jgi:predicted murein hydrolase (TIGR00659 family)
MEFLKNEFFLVAITLGLYHLFKLLQRKVGWLILNPILLTICALILFIQLTGIEYDDYQKAGEQIDFWLKPAVVALGVPLYLQLKTIRKQIVPILLSPLVGCIVGIISVVWTSLLLGASKEVVISLASKSVTTPIAMEISQQIGGIPSLTAAVVVITGILGAMIGYKILHISFVKNPISQGLSMGTAAHAVGTSASMELSARYGAFSSLGLILNGILTAALTPYLLSWMEFL